MAEIEVNVGNFMPVPVPVHKDRKATHVCTGHLKKQALIAAVAVYLLLLAAGSVLVICSAIRGLPL